jgi:hypothetical protein
MTRVGEIGARLNDDLTIIFNNIERAAGTLEAAHPAREILTEMRHAAQRCTWNAAQLLRAGEVIE